MAASTTVVAPPKAQVKSKAPKEAKSKKSVPAAAPKKARSYPPYSEMINEAILALKERTGSSQIAIAKFIEEKRKDNLPANFKKLLLVQLKKLVANGKLVKVKNSFKLPPKSASPGLAVAAVVEKTVAAKAKDKKAEVKKKKGTPVKKKVATKATTTKAAAAAKKSPGKKAVVAPKKKVVDTPKKKAVDTPKKKAVDTPKKKAPAKVVKKPKSIKSPVKKAKK